MSWVIFSCSPPLFDHWTLKSQNSCSRLIKLLISSLIIIMSNFTVKNKYKVAKPVVQVDYIIITIEFC